MGTTSKIFVLAGLVNIVGTLAFSAGFTNHYLTDLYPEVFSWMGLIAVMLWGAAYIAVSKSYRQAPALIAVFAVEKLVYFGTWLLWLGAKPASFQQIFATSLTTGAFYASYGLIDLAFGIFFAWVYFRVKKAPEA